MNFIALIPKTVYAAAVAALLALSLVLGLRVASLKTDVANAATKYSQLETKIANEARDRERIARENALEINRMRSKHAAFQQESVHAFHVQKDADRRRDQRLRGELERLRNDIRDYAAGGDGVGEADSIACRDQRDRSERLAGALDEALQLQGEAEAFIRQRDREVKLLKEVVSNDRALTQDKKDPQ